MGPGPSDVSHEEHEANERSSCNFFFFLHIMTRPLRSYTFLKDFVAHSSVPWTNASIDGYYVETFIYD